MPATTASKLPELTAPAAQLRGTLTELRREIEILSRRDQIRETQLRRLRAEVEEAGRLQRELVQSPLPEVRGARLRAFSRSASGVSGDFHHSRRVNEHQIAMLVADATGHGLAAGLLSATVLGQLQAQQNVCDNPADVLTRIHKNLLRYQLSECEFVAAVYAVYDERTRTVHLSRAGAPRPVLMRRGENPRPIVCEGAALGIDATTRLTSTCLELGPGDTLLLYTDGLETMLAQQSDHATGPDVTDWIDARDIETLHLELELLTCSPDRDATPSLQPDDVTLLSLHVD